MKEDTIKLVKKAIKGNVSAYGELIAEYQVYLYKTAFLYVKNEADSLDAVQECVTKGMLGIEKLKEPRYFKTWITKILINCIRQDKKRAQTISLDEYLETGIENYMIEEKVDLYDAIDSLKDQYKTVVILFYFQELKIREIAQIMDIPEGSVKAMLYRAKKQLRSRLTERVEEKEVTRYAK
ncbi:MAG: sigma-70 family RNA polymerase sigma factor [Lachnospiraceae bacterium]|nr:sigma-70 family RNA polymerase sigma factor [Lachnospiraceae bacterium]